MSDDSTYNGWANRTTWAVALWLANDESMYWPARSVAQNAADPAGAIESHVRSEWANLPTLARTDIGADLGAVDWHAVAWSLRDDEDEQAPEPGEVTRRDDGGLDIACGNGDVFSLPSFADALAWLDGLEGPR